MNAPVTTFAAAWDATSAPLTSAVDMTLPMATAFADTPPWNDWENFELPDLPASESAESSAPLSIFGTTCK